MNTAFLIIVAESPLLRPFNPKPCFEIISFVTVNVDGLSFTCFRLDCSFTLTTSKGLTNIASVTPAKKPAHENVCNDATCFYFVKYKQLANYNNPSRAITNGVGALAPNKKNCLYCSNVKN